MRVPHFVAMISFVPLVCLAIYGRIGGHSAIDACASHPNDTVGREALRRICVDEDVAEVLETTVRFKLSSREQAAPSRDTQDIILSHGNGWSGFRRVFLVPRDATHVNSDGATSKSAGSLAISCPTYTLIYSYNDHASSEPLAMLLSLDNRVRGPIIGALKELGATRVTSEPDGATLFDLAIDDFQNVHGGDRLLLALQTSAEHLMAEQNPREAIKKAVLLVLRSTGLCGAISDAPPSHEWKYYNVALRTGRTIIVIPEGYMVRDEDNSRAKVQYSFLEYDETGAYYASGALTLYVDTREGEKDPSDVLLRVFDR